MTYAFSYACISVRIPAADACALLCAAIGRRMEKPVAALGQPAVLRIGRAGIRVRASSLRCGQLGDRARRSARHRFRERRFALGMDGRRLQRRRAVCFQISQFHCRRFQLRVQHGLRHPPHSIISFFTFQSLSYVIDVYRRHCSARRNVLDVGLYVSLFPQLIAGPIVRYETVAAEISRRRCSWEDFATGTERFIIGLAKKVLIANNAAVVADYVFDMPPASLSAGTAWLGVFAYHIQIYFDFSGYSDMAIGLGRMFGFHFPENFNHPYISRSVSEFWRRWHISLGSWFRDYLYIPLGGNRKGAWRTVFNLFAVWALTGLWHGANYTFLCWGLMFFVLIMFEKAVRFERWRAGLLRGLMTTFFIMCSWALFRSDSISDAWTYLTAMFGCGADSTDMISFLWSEHAAVLITGTLFSFPVAGRLSALASGRRWGYAARYAVLLCLLFVSLCYVVKGSYSPFIYFNF